MNKRRHYIRRSRLITQVAEKKTKKQRYKILGQTIDSNKEYFFRLKIKGLERSFVATDGWI